LNNRERIASALAESDWPALRRCLVERPGAARHLIAALHTADEAASRRAARGFEELAHALEREKLLDQVRRLMWMLNEESGNNCPPAALALGHVARVLPEAVLPHLPVLELYAGDPSERMRRWVREGIRMIREAEMDTVPGHSSSPRRRGGEGRGRE